MATNNTATNPGTPNAKRGYKANHWCTQAVLGNTKGWATMVTVGKYNHTVTGIAYGPNGNPTAYRVYTMAGNTVNVPASQCSATYTGWATMGPHYGTCKLAASMGRNWLTL